MDGFYSIWSKPYLVSKKAEEFRMHDYDFLTMILSNELWKKNNGGSMLIADDKALFYCDSKKILDLFSNGTKTLKVDDDIDTNMFWAAGKLYALKLLDNPAAMIDLDLIIWKSISNIAIDSDIFVIHREVLNPEIYPDFDEFELMNGYHLAQDFDKNELPCNTALLYVKDLDFLNSYCDEAINFMKNAVKCNDNLKRMVFAEQRMISIMAKKYNKKINSMFPLAQDIGMQEYFTHVWGHKNILKFNYRERKEFCIKILKRLKSEFPNAYAIVSNLYEMKDYITLISD